MNHEYKKQVTDKYKNNSGKKRRREMMKVHHEQKRQRYHQNVQSKCKHDVNSQQNQYDGKKKKSSITRMQMSQGHNKQTTEKYGKIGQSKLHMIMNKPVELLFTQFIWEKISEHLCVDIVLPDVI